MVKVTLGRLAVQGNVKMPLPRVREASTAPGIFAQKALILAGAPIIRVVPCNLLNHPKCQRVE
jgi:hypothetical protein